MAEINDLNTTDASNTGRFPENMAPSAVNNGARALEGLLARWVQHFSGENFTAGTATGVNSLSISVVRASFSNTVTASKYIDGLSLLVTVPSTVTGPVYAGLNAHNKFPLVGVDGLSLTSSSILAGQKVMLSFDSSNNGTWQMLNPPAKLSATQIATQADLLAAGAHTIWVPAAAMRPTVTNGCAAITNVETTAGRPDMQVLDYDATADEAAQFQIAFPSSWDEGTITYRGFWTVAAAVTTGVAIALQGVAVANDNTIDVAYGTAIVVTDDALNAAEDLMVTAESAAVTIAGSPAAGEACFFRVFRDIDDGNDDMTQDMRLIGIQIIYTVDEAFDT